MSDIEHIKEVVKQPTQQSNVKAKIDPKSPTGISEDRSDGPTEEQGDVASRNTWDEL